VAAARRTCFGPEAPGGAAVTGMTEITVAMRTGTQRETTATRISTLTALWGCVVRASSKSGVHSCAEK